MRGNHAGAFEPQRIIYSRFERERGYHSYVRNRQQPHADFIVAGRALHAVIQFKIVLRQSDPRVQQRYLGMNEDVIHLDHRPYDIVKASMTNGFGQTQTKDLQQPAHFIRKFDGLVEQRLSAAQASS